MESNEQIWNLSKWRFLQEEASLWIFGNKVLEFVLLIGIVAWINFEFFSYGILHNIKYTGLIAVILSVSEIRSRIGSYRGYFDGYERGFKDAATRNCGDCGDTHDAISDSFVINRVIEEIKKNDEKISNESKIEREEQVQKGFSQLVGFILTWRKIK